MSVEPREDEYDELGRGLLARARRTDRRKRRLALLAVGASAMMATAVLSIVVRVPESALSIARPQEVPAFTGSDIGTQPGSAATQVACYPVADLSATPVMITREALDGKASRRTISAERATAECRGLWAAGTFDEAGSSDAHVLFGGDQHPTARRPANPRIPPLQACPQTGGVIAVLPDAGRNSIEPCREPASRTER